MSRLWKLCLILLEEKTQSSGELQVEGSHYHLGGGLGFSGDGDRDVWCWVANSCQVACKSGNNGEVNWDQEPYSAGPAHLVERARFFCGGGFVLP